MKFLIDAQLPPSLKQLFIDHGYDCIHTLDLENGNDTSDEIINKLSIQEKRILITKDSDFYQSFIIKKEPYKLIFVKLGNTSKNDLLKLFREMFDEIIQRIKGEEIILINRD